MHAPKTHPTIYQPIYSHPPTRTHAHNIRANGFDGFYVWVLNNIHILFINHCFENRNRLCEAKNAWMNDYDIRLLACRKKRGENFSCQNVPQNEVYIWRWKDGTGR